MGDAKSEKGSGTGESAHGFSSQQYWRRRYKRGNTSGAGSYGRLADYKASYINDLVQRERIRSVMEFGSGDGNQASLFNFPDYTGIDVSPVAVTVCTQRFADHPGWSFYLADEVPEGKRDLAMSLDVIYHLIEDHVFEGYMQRLFDHARRFVLIYASDHDAPTTSVHVRHRAFSAWVAQNRPDWKLVEAPEHPYAYTKGADPNQTTFASFKLFRSP